MNINKELVLSIAKNARLNLSEDEINNFTKELEEIITYFEKLDEVNTKNVKMSIQPVPKKNVLREDIIKESFDNKKALNQTRHKKDEFFMGPSAL